MLFKYQAHMQPNQSDNAQEWVRHSAHTPAALAIIEEYKDRVK
jgi:hypothetical protein